MRTSQYRHIGDPMARESHDDSTAEAQEPFMRKDEEQGWSGEPDASRAWASRSQHIWLRILPFRWLLDVVLVLVIAGLFLDRSYHMEEYGQLEGAGDLTGFAPKSE